MSSVHPALAGWPGTAMGAHQGCLWLCLWLCLGLPHHSDIHRVPLEPGAGAQAAQCNPGHGSPRAGRSWSPPGAQMGQDRGTVARGSQHGQGSSAEPPSALVSGADLINSRSVFPGHMLSCIQNTFVRTSIFNAIYAKCCCKKQPLT